MSKSERLGRAGWLSRAAFALALTTAAAGTSTCQPKFDGTRLVSARSETPGVRIGDVPIWMHADGRSQRALDGLSRELAQRGLTVHDSPSATTRIELVTRGASGESYRIEVTPGKILLEGEGPEGTYYAAMDLLNRLQPYGAGSALVPFASTLERPLFGYRGMHLDVARHFFKPAEIERLIDVFASLRINVMHLHFSDDQGFSLLLSGDEQLATRLPSGEPRAYTKEQIANLVAFAAARFVTIVPEIDVPGHTRSWLAAHPELACPLGEKSFDLATKGGVYPEILCAGNPEVRTFVKARIREIAEMFPGQYVHIGGDEVRTDRWKKCPKCQARGRWLRAEAADRARAKDRAQKENGTHELAAKAVPLETRLYDDFVADVAQAVGRTTKIAIGWDETRAVEDGPQILQLWRDEKDAAELLASGKPVILSPLARTYFNQKNAESAQGPGEGGPLGWRDVATIDWRPLARSGRAGALLGGEGALWTEHVESIQEAEQLYFPRALVLAEVLWRGHFAPGAGEAGERWLADRFRRLAAFGVQFYLSPPSEVLPRSAVMSAGKIAFQPPRDLPGAVVRIRVGAPAKAGAGEVTETDPVSVSLPDGVSELRAATFWNGRRSEVVTGQFVVEPPRPAIPATAASEGGCMAVATNGRFEMVPSSFKGASRRYLPCDVVGVLGGKPGAVRAVGAFQVDKTGVVRVSLKADDGAKLWIDGVLVVDHDGVHAASTRLGEIALGAGRHEYELRYADVGGQASLEVGLDGVRAGSHVSLFEISETR